MGYGLYEIPPTEKVRVPMGLFEEIRDTYVAELETNMTTEELLSAIQQAGSLDKFQSDVFCWFMRHKDHFFDGSPPPGVELLHAAAFAEAMGILLKRAQGDNI